MKKKKTQTKTRKAARTTQPKVAQKVLQTEKPLKVSDAPLLPYLILLQALAGTLGSLYYSTFGDPVKNFMNGTAFPVGEGILPCELCWYARILMYPIVFISIVGFLKDDRKFVDYVLPLSIVGVFLEIFHYGLQKFNFSNPFGCTLSNPCNALDVQYFGFVTIPFLGLIAFSLITAAALFIKWQDLQSEKTESVAKNS